MKIFQSISSSAFLLAFLGCFMLSLCSCDSNPSPSSYTDTKIEIERLEVELKEMKENRKSSWRWITCSPRYNIHLEKNIKKTEKRIEELKRSLRKQKEKDVYITRIDIKGLPNPHPHYLGRTPDLYVHYKRPFSEDKLIHQQKGCPTEFSFPLTPNCLVHSGSFITFEDKTFFNREISQFSLDEFIESALQNDEMTGTWTKLVPTEKEKEFITYVFHYQKKISTSKAL